MSTDGFWVMAAIGVAVFWIASPPPDVEEKTVYFAYCGDYLHNTYHCPDDILTKTKTFKVSVSQQLVVSESLYTLMPCKVYDADNWECKGGLRLANAGTNVTSISDGDYRETVALDSGSIGKDGKETTFPREQPISYIEYVIRSTISFVKRII
ncbi:MAG: hypothetical protein P8P30_02085 [Rickettsiales bacterium]|nr:hypothetical protein [Rickettsiales bacterium]